MLITLYNFTVEYSDQCIDYTSVLKMVSYKTENLYLKSE